MRAALLALRRNMPASVRGALRTLKLAVKPRPASPRLPAALVRDCRFCESRHALVQALPQDGMVAEIGVDTGEFSHWILSAAHPRELHLVDLDFSRVRADVRGHANARLHRGESSAILSGFDDDLFDWIYIDADHSYDAVAKDAAAAASKVKPGGYLVFNDFAHMDTELGSYGVHRAVVEFAIGRGWPFAWWAYESHGLYDVALRRPAGP